MVREPGRCRAGGCFWGPLLGVSLFREAWGHLLASVSQGSGLNRVETELRTYFALCQGAGHSLHFNDVGGGGKDKERSFQASLEAFFPPEQSAWERSHS